MRRDCPQQMSEAPIFGRSHVPRRSHHVSGRSQVPGRSQSSNTSMVEVAEPTTRHEDLTESELEQLLASRRLSQEKTVLPVTGQANTEEKPEQLVLYYTWIYTLRVYLSKRWLTLVLNQLLFHVQLYILFSVICSSRGKKSLNWSYR